MIRDSVFKRYFLPGFVFQSVVIAGGYGALTWLFLIVFVAPVLTLGVWKIRRRSGVGVREEAQA